MDLLKYSEENELSSGFLQDGEEYQMKDAECDIILPENNVVVHIVIFKNQVNVQLWKFKSHGVLDVLSEQQPMCQLSFNTTSIQSEETQ